MNKTITLKTRPTTNKIMTNRFETPKLQSPPKTQNSLMQTEQNRIAKQTEQKRIAKRKRILITERLCTMETYNKGVLVK